LLASVQSHAVGGLADLLHGGQQQANEDRDDGDVPSAGHKPMAWSISDRPAVQAVSVVHSASAPTAL
jgi:hypothetical protein